VEETCKNGLTPVPPNASLDEWLQWVKINKRELRQIYGTDDKAGPAYE
jgi:hypothetical protein